MLNPTLPLSKITTRDGRVISYRKIGSGDHRILFFHGFPGSSLQAELFSSCLEKLNLSVIAIDRPGYNGTSPAIDAQIRQVGFDAIAVTRAEGWDEFEVYGVSGGCPFAFWFVDHFPKRVQRFFVVSPLGPVFASGFKSFIPSGSRLALMALRFAPPWLMKHAKPQGHRTDRPLVLQKFFKLSPPDEVCMRDPHTANVMAETVREAFKQNGLGAQADAGVYMSPWPHLLESYQGPIDVWHGEDDRILPWKMGEATARLIPRAKFHKIPGEGHFSLSMNHVEAIVGRMEIVKTVLLKASLSQAWRAISDSSEFGLWFGMKLKGPFVAGHSIHGSISPTTVDPEVAAMQKPHEGKAVELFVDGIEPETCLRLKWHPFAIDPKKDYSKEPMTLITFALSEESGGVRLTIRESGFEGIPEERRDEAFKANDGGWQKQTELISKYLASKS